MDFPKRAFDIVLALFLALATFPIGLLIALAVKATSTGSVLFWSDRVGRNDQLFSMPKFRSMYIGTPNVPTHLLSNSKNNLTPIGNFLRKSSLDEIPQLWCVLLGAMSFVGPRPALFNQTDLINLRAANGTNTLKPGITGWAQINGRDSITDVEKSIYDKEYLENKSFWMDIIIIIRTFTSVILRKNISH